jgi:hypothetical protein
MNNGCTKSHRTPTDKRLTSIQTEVPKVLIDMEVMEFKYNRIANLPPGVLKNHTTAALAPYGKIITIRNKVW